MRMIRIYEWLRIGMLTATIVFSFSTTIAMAESGDYTLLAPLPGLSGIGPCPASGCTTNLPAYLPAVFKLSIGIAAAMAFFMITLGGITYATADAVFKKEQGKKWITNAIWGLLLVIGAWVILNTINPQILNFDLVLPKPKIETPPSVATSGVSPGYVMTEAQKIEDQDVRNILKKDAAPYAGPCTEGQTTGCVNLNGLPNKAVTGIQDLNKACGGCYVVITGGTEGGHVGHGIGISVVDVRREANLTNYIITNKTRVVQTSLGPVYTVTINGSSVQFLDEKIGDPHWHVTF